MMTEKPSAEARAKRLCNARGCVMCGYREGRFRLAQVTGEIRQAERLARTAAFEESINALCIFCSIGVETFRGDGWFHSSAPGHVEPCGAGAIHELLTRKEATDG